MTHLPTTIGFPNMLTEKGEKRVFLPDFIHWLVKQGLTVSLEKDYGKRLGLTFSDYQQGNPNITSVTRQDAFQQDIVLILRSPSPDEYQLIGQNSTFISMIHFPTRPDRVSLLTQQKTQTISLDSIADYKQIRLVENMRSVAWNGLEAGFDVLEQIWPDMSKSDGSPISTLILGTGMVGKHAIEAATKLGNLQRNQAHILAGGNGAVAVSIGRNLTNNHQTLSSLFANADILVDATQRKDTSQPVIPNSLLSHLPDHAVIVDLSVDPYALDSDPPVVKGIEGIPQGNLDKYIFSPTDSDYLDTIPSNIPSDNKRHTVSCYSWPGVHPRACMTHYATQLQPLLSVLLKKGYDQLSPSDNYFEQSLYNGTLKAFVAKSQPKTDSPLADRKK